MRIPRIFTELHLASGAELSLDERAARHLASALRMTVGQEITLFNGEGGEYAAELLAVGKKGVSVKVTAHRNVERESPLHLHLAIGVSRGERMDWIVQKATELGVSEITPLFTERTEVKLSGDRLDKKQQHWQQIAISACEQSQRNRVPTLHTPTHIDQWLSAGGDTAAELKLVLHHRTAKKLSEHAPQTHICLLVGPEGGLSDYEIDQAMAGQFQPLALGPRVMRTETAPLAAISILQSLWGDMG